MPTRNYDDADSRTRPGGTSDSREGYRWTCPFCGKSRINRSEGEDGERNALAALRTHVVASGGDGHGPRNQQPEETVALEEHVDEVAGEGSYGRSRQ